MCSTDYYGVWILGLDCYYRHLVCILGNANWHLHCTIEIKTFLRIYSYTSRSVRLHLGIVVL